LFFLRLENQFEELKQFLKTCVRIRTNDSLKKLRTTKDLTLSQNAS
jgi:hypothetical protein